MSTDKLINMLNPSDDIDEEIEGKLIEVGKRASLKWTRSKKGKLIPVSVTGSVADGRSGNTAAEGISYRFVNSEAAALVARMTTPPVGSRKMLIDTLVGSLKTTGIWAKLDALYIMAAADSQAAKLNWISSSFNLTAVSAPTFTVDRGFAGNGTSSYLDTGFDATTAPSAKFILNSAHLGVYIETVRAGVAAVQMGASANSGAQEDAIYGYYSDGNFYPRINSIGGGVANSGSKGRLIASRTASTGVVAYQNGVSLGTVVTASGALSANNIYLGAENFGAGSQGNYSSDLLGVASIGGGLSPTEVASFDAALLGYLQAVGAS